MPVGQRLKALRTHRHISIREVEKASGLIAEAKRSEKFRISNGWLAQLEKGVSEPGICKLFSLSVIYHVKFCDLIKLYDVDVNETERYETVANPQLTQLLSAEIEDDSRPACIPRTLVATLSHRATSLIPGAMKTEEQRLLARGTDSDAALSAYGHIGLSDFTMYPLIWPGSFVRLDVSQTSPHEVTWHNEYERPIYFIELRGSYACGWCELQANQLLIIPHHSSPATIRRFTYPKEAEIVGRVIGFETRCVD